MTYTLTNILSITVLLCFFVSCNHSSCDKKIKQLEQKLAKTQDVKVDNPIINSTQKRDTIIARYENGSKKLLVTYMGMGSNEQVIKKVSYYSNGKKKEEENYKQNQLNGKYFEYYRNGQISVNCTFKNGQRDGDYVEYYFNGTIWERGRFIKGDYDGEYNTYFADGQLKSKEIYKNGDRIEATWYNSKGEIEFEN